jgi:hypothetical protein
VKVFYHKGLEAKKQKKKFSQAELDEAIKLAFEKKEAEDAIKAAKERDELVQQAVTASVDACRTDIATNLIPTVINWVKENPHKTADDFPMPSFIGSNSVKITTAPSPAHATAPAPGPAPAPAHSSLSSVSGALGGPSSLAELDALMVLTCRTNIYLEYSVFVAFEIFYAADMSLQADETPCTVLYLIKGQKVDVGKAVITKPLELRFHVQQIPVGHFRVNLSSVVVVFSRQMSS